MPLPLLLPEPLELTYQTFLKRRSWALPKPSWLNRLSRSIRFPIRHIWMESTLSFQNQQRIESCLMQVWARSLQVTLHSMEVRLNYNPRIQIWSPSPIRKRQFKVVFQAILKGGTFLKVAWAARNDLEEPLSLLQIVAQTVLRSLTRREHKPERLCSTNLSPFWIQVQKTVSAMRTTWL